MKLKDGTGTHYGLGVSVGVRDGHRSLAHTGEVGGFVAANAIYPDDKVAIAVLTNQEASSAASGILQAVSTLVFAPVPVACDQRTCCGGGSGEGHPGAVAAGEYRPESVYSRLQLLLSDETIGDFESSLAPLGEVKSVTQQREVLRGGMTARTFDVVFGDGTTVTVSTYMTADGKYEQFLVEVKS